MPDSTKVHTVGLPGGPTSVYDLSVLKTRVWRELGPAGAAQDCG